MEKVGILLVSKCLSAAAIIDALSRSDSYSASFYVAEKQMNPYSVRMAQSHVVIPDLNVAEVARFAKQHAGDVSFGLTDTEDFVISGGRDEVERLSRIPMICVTKDYAVEKSKADQRSLFEKLFRDANPDYRIFNPRKEKIEDAIPRLMKFVAEVTAPVLKPDEPARGAGVGVWGNDFSSEEEMLSFFRNLFSKGTVVAEEKIIGEESSFHAFSDGKHFVPAPQTRDYKRSLDEDGGRLTGGMGSYRSTSNRLPFIRPSEMEHVVRAEEAAFRKWKGRGSNPNLRGIVLYDALMHTGRGFKILERNSRGGNTEQINLLSTMKDDFVDVCLRILEGSLRKIEFSRRASVVTCAVPTEYGIPGVAPPAGRDTIDLQDALTLEHNRGGALRVYPMDVRIDDGVTRIGTSRSVAVVGLGPSLEDARTTSLEGCAALKGELRYRRDIASRESIEGSVRRMSSLRSSA